MKFELSFTNKEITPWGGMVFLKQMLDKIALKQAIESQKNPYCVIWVYLDEQGKIQHTKAVETERVKIDSATAYYLMNR